MNPDRCFSLTFCAALFVTRHNMPVSFKQRWNFACLISTQWLRTCPACCHDAHREPSFNFVLTPSPHQHHVQRRSTIRSKPSLHCMLNFHFAIHVNPLLLCCGSLVLSLFSQRSESNVCIVTDKPVFVVSHLALNEHFALQLKPRFHVGAVNTGVLDLLLVLTG